ncbi:MAG: mechanosensitive ion channel family protein [Pyrobaculum sp.]
MDIIGWLQANWLNLIYVAFVIIVALFISVFIERAVRRALLNKVAKPVIDNIAKFIRYSILILASVIALASLGFDITGALVAGGFLGLVIGLAAQTSISNFISGVLLMFERPFSLGDYIHIGDVVGAVVDIGILSTTIVTWDGVRVRIPNSQIYNSGFRNYTASRVRLVRIDVQIPYTASIDKAAEVITKKLREQWYVLEEPEPVVFAREFADSGIVLEVRAWTAGVTWFNLYSSLATLVKRALDEAGIEIPYPQRVVWFATPLPANLKA